MSDGVDVRKWILWPAVFTLAITLLRVIGEVQEWDADWFGRSVGGQAGADDSGNAQQPGLIGITFLAPLFGLWFGLRLAREGRGPNHRGLAFLFPLLGFALTFVAFLGAMSTINKEGEGKETVFLDSPAFPWALCGVFVVAWVGTFLARRGWPALWRVVVSYGWAARIPVILVTFVLCFMDLGTHYEKPHPAMPQDLSTFVRASVLSLAQVGVWIPFTVFSGMLFGALPVLFIRKRAAA